MSGELFTIEASHGKPRLVAPRPSDVGTVPTDEERKRDRGPGGLFRDGNKAAVGRSAKRAAKRHLLEARERVRVAVQEALDRGVPTELAECAASESDRILADALTLYDAARSDCGSSSILVIGPCGFYAAELAIGNYLLSEAAKAGLTTELGIALHDRALAAEQAAMRSLTAALAAAKAISLRTPKRRNRVVEEIEAAGELAADDTDNPEPASEEEKPDP